MRKRKARNGRRGGGNRQTQRGWRKWNRERPWLKFAILSAVMVLGLWLGWGCWQTIEEVGIETQGYYAALAVAVPVKAQDFEGKKLVALTFDDGPSAATTGRLLDILAEKGVRATFFVLGSRAEQNPEILRRQVAEHEVGSHTVGHIDMTKMSVEAVRADTETMRGVIAAAGGELQLVRPPYGSIGVAAREGTGTPLVLWTVDPEDWKVLDAAKVTEHVVSHVEPWGITLLHDFYPTSVSAALDIVDQLQAEGYTFVTVKELFRIRGVEPQAGCLYASPDKLRSLG